MLRFLRHLFGLDAKPRLRQRIGFVPPGKEPELVPLDECSEIDSVSGDTLKQEDDDEE